MQAIRLPKSGSEWDNSDLVAYNIQINNIPDQNVFFEVDDWIAPPNGTYPHAFYHHQEDFIQTANLHIDPGSLALVKHYLFAEQTDFSQVEAAIDNFAQELLKEMRYEDGDTQDLIALNRNLKFFTCGTRKAARPNVSVLNMETNILQLVQEDKCRSNQKNIVAQMIAKAIAAFQNNNQIREELGLDLLHEEVIKGITMTGTFPTFYRIPVTQQLADCVNERVFPNNPTIVDQYTPGPPKVNTWRNINHRQHLLQCYYAFKQ